MVRLLRNVAESTVCGTVCRISSEWPVFVRCFCKVCVRAIHELPLHTPYTALTFYKNLEKFLDTISLSDVISQLF